MACSQAGGLPLVAGCCSSSAATGNAHLQEVAADAMCQLASYEALRPALLQASAVQALAALLQAQQQEQQQEPQPAEEGQQQQERQPGRSYEVSVRALMALGMLLAGSPEAQEDLAQSAGAVGALLALVRQQDDADCRSVARDLLGLLEGNPTAKEHMVTALRTLAQEQPSRQEQE